MTLRLAVAFVLCLCCSEADAIVRYLVKDMSCTEVHRALERDGVAILYRRGQTGSVLYDRFVEDGSFCQRGDSTAVEQIAVADTDNCKVEKCISARRLAATERQPGARAGAARCLWLGLARRGGQFLGHRAVENLLEFGKRPRHRSAIHDAVIVVDAHVDEAVLVDRPVIEQGRQRRQRVERLSAQPGIDGELEGAEPVCPLPADIQPEPHQQPAHRARQAGKPQRLPEILDLEHRA